MKELTFFGGGRLFKFQIRKDKSVWAWDYRLKAWLPTDKIKIDIKEDLKFIKNHTYEEVAKEMRKEMAKGGAKLIKEEER